MADFEPPAGKNISSFLLSGKSEGLLRKISPDGEWRALKK
jgi:hypothetical protein